MLIGGPQGLVYRGQHPDRFTCGILMGEGCIVDQNGEPLPRGKFCLQDTCQDWIGDGQGRNCCVGKGTGSDSGTASTCVGKGMLDVSVATMVLSVAGIPGLIDGPCPHSNCRTNPWSLCKNATANVGYAKLAAPWHCQMACDLDLCSVVASTTPMSVKVYRGIRGMQPPMTASRMDAQYSAQIPSKPRGSS